MPETSAEALRCGQNEAQPKSSKGKHPVEPRRLETPPPPPESRNVTPPSAGSQRCSIIEGVRQKQQRPSVLRQLSQTASRRQHENHTAISALKQEVDTTRLSRSSSPDVDSSPRQSHHFFSRRDGAKQSSSEARLLEGVPEATRSLFVSGYCQWPGCDAVTEDLHSFFKHLSSDHSHSDRSINQWKVQQGIVQSLETKLFLEKQKLNAMQLHLHLSENKYTEQNLSSEWPHSLLYLPQPLVTDGDAVQQWAVKHLEEFSQHGNRAAASAHFLPDLVPSLDFYKYNNIRPPYTYAFLIRWSILESPDKQRTLNEIYNWFTTMFFYFRHNPATWKNAVRHNLSLHKCFVRVEGGKGAVWTVDEAEYQRRKGQKYHRDCPVKWFKSCSHYYPEDP